jgi:hypothetical protein
MSTLIVDQTMTGLPQQISAFGSQNDPTPDKNRMPLGSDLGSHEQLRSSLEPYGLQRPW